MTAVKRDLFIEQGATFTMGFNWLRESPPGSGIQVPYDLTNCTVRMQIRKTQQLAAMVDATSAGVDPMVLLGGTANPVVFDKTNGRVDVKVPAASTSLLTLKAALYDLEVEMSNGDVFRLLEGGVTVSPNITQLPAEPVMT